MGNDDGNGDDSPDDPFRTRRLQTLSGLSPSYAPGEFVYLQATVPGFAPGTRFKVISARATGPSQYNYELVSGDRTLWVSQDDVRGTAPDSATDALAKTNPGNAFSMTQRMQTMTLSQRMSALGIGGGADMATTQRMRAFNLEDRLKREAAGTAAPEPDGPVTGMPPYKDDDKPPK